MVQQEPEPEPKIVTKDGTRSLESYAELKLEHEIEFRVELDEPKTLVKFEDEFPI